MDSALARRIAANRNDRVSEAVAARWRAERWRAERFEQAAAFLPPQVLPALAKVSQPEAREAPPRLLPGFCNR